MPFYLSTIVGTGTEDDPFRVPGMDQPGMGWVDLRPDSTVVAGRGLVYLPTALVDPALIRKLADAYDEPLAAASKAAMNTSLGVTITTAKFNLACLQVLQQGTLDGIKWKPINPASPLYLGGCVPGWVPGQLFLPMALSAQLAGGMIWNLDKVRWLGGQRIVECDGYDVYQLRHRGPLIAVFPDGRAVPVVSGGASVSESWPTDKNPLDSPSTGEDQVWTKDVVGGDVKVLTGQLTNVAAGAATFLRCGTAVGTQDQHAETQCTISTRNAASRSGRAQARKIDSTAVTFYASRMTRTTGATLDFRGIEKFVAGTATTLASDTTDPGAGTVTEFVEALGSSISGQVVVTFGPVTDTAITGNLKGGVSLRDSGTAGGAVNLDNFLLFDLLPTGTPAQMQQLQNSILLGQYHV